LVCVSRMWFYGSCIKGFKYVIAKNEINIKAFELGKSEVERRTNSCKRTSRKIENNDDLNF